MMKRVLCVALLTMLSFTAFSQTTNGFTYVWYGYQMMKSDGTKYGDMVKDVTVKLTVTYGEKELIKVWIDDELSVYQKMDTGVDEKYGDVTYRKYKLKSVEDDSEWVIFTAQQKSFLYRISNKASADLANGIQFVNPSGNAGYKR